MSDLQNFADTDSSSEFTDVSDAARPNKGKRKQRDSSKWKRNVNKKRRSEGKSYLKATNEGNIPVKGKKFSSVTNCCPKKCCDQVLVAQQNNLFDNFYGLGDRCNQHLYLSGCMNKKDIKTRILNATNPIETLWEYNINLPEINVRHAVCREFLCKLFQISARKVRTVQSTLKKGSLDFKEKRGTHGNRPNKIDGSVWNHVEEHWASIPNTPSHYSANKSKQLYFDNSSLTVTELFRLFKVYFQEKTKKPLTNMKYNTYFQYFRKNSPFSFRKPRTDTCDMCEKFTVKMKENPTDMNTKTMFQLHERKVAAYKELKNKTIEEAKSNNDILVLEFDYGQNLPLPKLTVNSVFYKRQLWYYVFNIHCHNNEASSMYTYLETESSKDPDTVASFLYHYISNRLQENNNYKEIVLMSDNAGGQNKNHKMLMFCSFLAVKFKVKVTQLYPVRGHSYCQCDRNFGAYSNVLKRTARIATAAEYDQIIASKSEIIRGYELLRTWSSSLQVYFTEYKNITSKKTPFRIQQYCRLMYHPSGTISASSSYLGTFIPFNFLLRGVNMDLLSPDVVQVSLRQPLKPAKENDLRSLFCFLSAGEQNWFEEVIEKPKQLVLQLPDQEGNENPDNDENENEEESDCENIVAYEFP